jgi:acetyltransferase-like isoleucine patch superfamily enzyme
MSWVATDASIATGVTIAREALIGSLSSVFQNILVGMFCAGFTAKPLSRRV